MNDIPVFVHDGRTYLEPKYILRNDVDAEIRAWKAVIFDSAKEIDADHFVYATKTYNAVHDYLKRVDLYHVPLSNKEFDKRIKETDDCAARLGEAVWYGVWHKGTAY